MGDVIGKRGCPKPQGLAGPSVTLPESVFLPYNPDGIGMSLQGMTIRWHVCRAALPYSSPCVEVQLVGLSILPQVLTMGVDDFADNPLNLQPVRHLYEHPLLYSVSEDFSSGVRYFYEPFEPTDRLSRTIYQKVMTFFLILSFARERFMMIPEDCYPAELLDP